MAYEEINERAFGWDDESRTTAPILCCCPRETTCSL